jgi:hypothetical protein
VHRSIYTALGVLPMKAVTLRLDPTDHERLEAEAARLGMAPGTLARVYVRAGLSGSTTEAERRRLGALVALERLAELTADLRSVDGVAIAREGREDLGRRSLPP